MKRKALFLFLVTVASSSVFSAASNKQEIIPVTSDCQEAMDILYVRQGLALPSQTASYSVAELEGMLQKIDTSKMDADQKATYAYVREVLDAHSYAGKGVGFKLNAYLNPEAYLHENTEDFSGRYGDETTLREQWFRGWMQQQPAASVDIGFYAADQLYAQTDFSYGPTWAYKAFGTSNFSMNIPGAFGMALTEVDANIPYHAYTSFGTDYWNVEIGRDRLNWGPGQTGNLLIGDNLKYQNIAKYTVFGKSFKFTFLVSFFPHQMNYKGNEGTNSQYDELEGLEMLLAHKLEWRLFHDKLNLSIAEAIMYADEDGVLDFSVLNPMNVFHSYFMKANCNSIASLNLDFTVGTTNFYFQGVMDEYTVPYVESKSGSYYPDAWGVLFGLRNYQPYGKVTEITSLEGAYTLPYLYLRGKSGEDVQDGYGINFVVATRVFSDGDMTGISYDKEFLGYKYGGDAIVFNVNKKFVRYGKWKFEINSFNMIHGTFNINTLWRTVTSDVFTPTTSNPDADKTDLDAIEYTSVLGFYGDFSLLNTVKPYSQVDFVAIKNKGNVSSSFDFDVQLTVGARINL